jgi:hypothetical protein
MGIRTRTTGGSDQGDPVRGTLTIQKVTLDDLLAEADVVL